MVMERVKGIEPSYAAWEAAVLPLNYTRFEVRRHYRRSACTGKRIFSLCDGLLSDCFYLRHQEQQCSRLTSPAFY